MTIEEAIKRIEEYKVIHHMNEPQAVLISEALDMAIAALKSKQAQLNACELIKEMVDYKTVAENIG